MTNYLNFVVTVLLLFTHSQAQGISCRAADKTVLKAFAMIDFDIHDRQKPGESLQDTIHRLEITKKKLMSFNAQLIQLNSMCKITCRKEKPKYSEEDISIVCHDALLHLPNETYFHLLRMIGLHQKRFDMEILFRYQIEKIRDEMNEMRDKL